MKKISILVIFGLLVGAMLAIPALAQNEFGLNNLSNIATYSTRSLTDTIVGIVNIILGFLGVIAVLLFLYAGWLWLSSRGDAQKITKSKQIMASTVIGLLIIFASYAITNFVIARIGEATGVINGTPSGGGTTLPGGVTCSAPASTSEIKICQVYPAGAAPGNYMTITGWNFGDYDAAESRASLLFGGTATILNLVSCNGTPIWNLVYQDESGNRFYRIRAVVPDIATGVYGVRVRNIITAGELADAFTITTGSVGLNIACLTPDHEQAGFNGVVATGINFGTPAAVNPITMQGWQSGSETSIAVNHTAWSESSITFNIPTNALAGNVVITNDVGSSDISYFQVTCSAPSQCTSGCCYLNSECRAANICVAGATVGPYISSISPNNGEIGNFVTIFGQNFGTVPGIVYFNGSPTLVEGRVPSTINPTCVDYWHDNYIVIAVPVGTIDGNVFIRTGGATPLQSNPVYFDQNNIERPGLCLLNPTAGRYEDNTTVTGYGIKFLAADQMLYSNIPGYNLTVVSDNEINSTLPNLQDGNVGVQVEKDGQYSNPLIFNVDSSLVGEPVIESFDPAVPSERGGYFTLRGRNFGNSPGHVYFHHSASAPGINTVEASYDFPSMCRSNYWSNNQIIVKVSGLETMPAPHNFDTYIVRTDGVESNRVNHDTSTDYPGAGLCAVFPNSAPNNYQGVNLYGEYFGTTPGNISFTGSALFSPVSPAVWNDTQVLGVTVPADADSGDLRVQRIEGGADLSNPLYFGVGSCSNNSDCPTGQECCEGNLGNYCATECSLATSCQVEYTLTTENNPFGLYYNYNCASGWQSPTPWPDEMIWDGSARNSEDAFIEANIAFFFTRNVLDTDLTDTSKVVLRRCTNQACTAFDETVSYTGQIQNPGSNFEGLLIDPVSNLTPDRWYKVDFIGNFRSQFTNEYWNLVQHDPTLRDLGGWKFKTRPNDLACQVSSISINPYASPWKDVYLGNFRDFYAAPVAGNCNICGGNYRWDWSKGGANPGAADMNPLVNLNSNIGHTQMSTNFATENLTPPYFDLQCRVTQNTINYDAHVFPIIKAPTLLVENYGPICDNSCLNGTVWIDFNTQVLTADLTSSNFIIQDCNGDIDCATPSGNIVSSINQDGNWLVTLGHPNFESNHYYRVTVLPIIRNVHGYSLGSLFQWTFRAGAANCLVASTSISPADFTAPAGTTVLYSTMAYSEPNLCYPGGQPIECAGSSCQWEWSSNLPLIASIPNVNVNVNTANAIAEGVARITATANQTTAPDFSSIGILRVTTTTGPGTVSHGAPLVFDEQPFPDGVDNICPNAGVMMRFTELMDQASVREKVAIYGIPANIPDTNGDGVINIGDIAGLFNGVDYLERVQANYSILYEDSDGDFIDDQTLVLINPINLLRSNTFHRVLVRGSVSSIYGVALDSSQYNFDVDGDDIDDSYSWSFTTNSDTCLVSFLITYPPHDWFFCGGNSCVNDRNASEAGNQHDYFALPMDVHGIYLNWGLFNYNWSLNSDGIDLLFNNDDSVANSILSDPQFKVGDQNGVETLIVSVDNPSMGSASASIGIDIFLCENPWPSMTSFPWQDNDYNFATYYCPDVDGDDAIPSLPVLDDPWQNPNIAGTPHLLREYVFPVRLAANENSNLGSLAKGNYNQASNWWSRLLTKVSNIWPTKVAKGQGVGTDIIAFRIFENPDHLSVADWFAEYAPNPSISGQELEVDGYPAIRVGNTVYISAFNDAGSLYTNIYLLATNLEPRESTLEIFNQLLENFKLNTNIIAQNNICGGGPSAPDFGDACSSDFDCSAHICQSRGLKLRRDLVRLGDLLNINGNLEDYGNGHKACSNNSLISCTVSAQCPSGGNCIAYFPLLNAGTFVRGQSNSSWPSWQAAFAPSFNTTLASDPINLFNGCSGTTYPGYDPNTCWNEETLTFSCPIGSLIYHYTRNDTGVDYDLSANFESDLNFSSLVAALDSNINTNLSMCTAASANLANPQCGNGRVDPAHCSNPNYNNQTDCESNGGQWLVEVCDGGYRDNMCDLVLGAEDWWNEQRSGCYPAGSIVGGNLVECTWYEPDEDTMRALCGGYCGNNALETTYENCEDINGTISFGGVDYSCAGGIAPTCSASSCQAVCGASETPAAACGDGVWTEGVEECEFNAPPNANGLDNLDCTLNGNISCNNTCHAVCDTGVAYEGSCGNSTIEAPEQCDFGFYDTPTPNQSSIGNPYVCQTDCTFGTEYCNDGNLQTSFDEVCDTSLAISPTPQNSNRFNQYQCRTVDGTLIDPLWTKCTRTWGGWCGDGVVTSTYGEVCDSAYHPSPAQSSSTNQYSCRPNCMEQIGGWCGDTIAQNGLNGQIDYGEDCDYANYSPPLPRFTNPTNQYICSPVCLADSGGYCGDGTTDDGTGGTFDGHEECDYGQLFPGVHVPPINPWNSNADNPYNCPYCGIGSYCGDGSIYQDYEICTDLVAGNWQSYALNETACIAAGHNWRPVEQCDIGLTIPEKKAELVFVFDMSRSMRAAAVDLCNALQSLLDSVTPGTTFRVTVATLADDNFMNSRTYDDLSELTSLADAGSHRPVFEELVRSCGTAANPDELWERHLSDLSSYADVSMLNKFRYISFYDNLTNNISGGVTRFDGPDNGTGLTGCNNDTPGGRIENWGYATYKIINNYNWLPGYQRIVIPVTDEYAWCGGDVSCTQGCANSTLSANENNTVQAGSDDILMDIIDTANTSDPVVHVSPVILRFDGNSGNATGPNDGEVNQDLGEALAAATGGVFNTTYLNNTSQLMVIINSAFCDGNGDGAMDCSLPPGAAAMASLPSLSLPSYSIPTDSLARTLNTTVTLGGTATWWDAVSNNPWITNVTKSGSNLSFNVAANTGGARIGSITLTAGATAGSPITITLTINQASPAPPTVSLSPSTFSRDSNAATLNTSVTLGGSATTWTAATTFSAWISGLNQVGNTLYFNLAANTGPDRTGTITVTASSPTGLTATTVLTINQTAPPIPVDSTPPTEIGNTLVATALDGQIRLDWAAATDASGIVVYQVERISPSPFTFTSNFNTFTNTGLTNGVTYTYRVIAHDLAVPDNNYSNYSNIVSAAPIPAAIPPQAPISLTATPQVAGVYLTWGIAVTGDPISYFRLERSTNFSFSTIDVVSDINFASFTGSYTDAFPLSNPTVTYYYRVKSVNSSSGLESIYAGPVNATIPDTTAPSIPTNLTATSLGGLQFRLNWTASNDNIGVDHYTVEYAANAWVYDGTGTNIGSPTTNSIDYTVAASSVTNSFRVQAYDAAGNASGWQTASNVGIFFTPDTIPPNTPPPANLTASVSFGNVNLSWTAAGDNIGVAGYDLLRAGTSGGPYTEITCPSMSCSVTAITQRRNISVPPGTYYYVVRAYDGAGNRSNNSNEVTITVLPAAPPTDPTNLSASAFGRLVTLSWTASTDDGAVTNYEVQYQNPLYGTWGLVGSPTTNTYTHGADFNYAQASYRVRAVDNDGLYSAYTAPLTVTIDGASCTEAFCNQWDSPLNTANRIACGNQCAQNSGCCQICATSGTNAYVGCQVNPGALTNTCPSNVVMVPVGVRCD